MGVKQGFEAKLFYKRGGVAAAGDWTEATNIRDLSFNLEKGEADATTRGNDGWKAIIAKLKDATVEAQSVWDTDDAFFDALFDAWFSGDVIGLEILDGPRATGTGLRADFQVTRCNRTENLEEAIVADWAAKPAYSSTAPVWLEEGATGTGTAP